MERKKKLIEDISRHGTGWTMKDDEDEIQDEKMQYSVLTRNRRYRTCTGRDKRTQYSREQFHAVCRTNWERCILSNRQCRSYLQGLFKYR